MLAQDWISLDYVPEELTSALHSALVGKNLRIPLL